MAANVLTRSKVLFNAPEEFEVKAPTPPVRAHDWGSTDVTAYCKMIKEAGYFDGAIVTRRNAHVHDRRFNRNWGIITNVQHYRGNSSTPYMPITVKWFDKGDLTTGWHDNLLLIHPAKTPDELDKIFKAQLEA